MTLADTKITEAGYYEPGSINGVNALFFYSSDKEFSKDELPSFCYWYEVGEETGMIILTELE